MFTILFIKKLSFCLIQNESFADSPQILITYHVLSLWQMQKKPNEFLSVIWITTVPCEG